MLSFKSFWIFVTILLFSVNISAEGLIGPNTMRHTVSLPALLVVAWSTLLKGIDSATKEEVEKHLEMGKKMLASGQLTDALTHYHAAVEGDPTNYMTYYQRATVFLALGRSKSALPDLDKVVELKPDFTAARMQRANVKLKQGRLDDAAEDYKTVLQREPEHEDATRLFSNIEPIKSGLQHARIHFQNQNYQEVIDKLSPLIDLCPWDPVLRELRGESYVAQGDYFKAIGDIRTTTKLINDNTAGYLKLSNLYYVMGEAEESLTEIRECLKLDPDHKECFSHYKKVKKLVKQMQSIQTFINEEKWQECVDKVAQMQNTEDNVFAYVQRANSHLCHCYSKEKLVKETFEACNAVLEEDENDVDALCHRAEAYIVNEQFEEAISDYQTAEGINSELKKVHEGLKRAQKLLKQSKKRDYYKILGVKRNAKKPEITKAYRKLAAQWHPDRFEESEKEMAQKKFIDIAAAKEVLTDPEKRQKFDNGEDPLDPEEQAGSNPWNQGFNPFGAGGGFQGFKFHFN